MQAPHAAIRSAFLSAFGARRVGAHMRGLRGLAESVGIEIEISSLGEIEGCVGTIGSVAVNGSNSRRACQTLPDRYPIPFE